MEEHWFHSAKSRRIFCNPEYHTTPNGRRWVMALECGEQLLDCEASEISDKQPVELTRSFKLMCDDYWDTYIFS